MSYNEKMQQIVGAYRLAGERWPATAKEIAGWAVTNGQWKPQPFSIIGQCANHLTKAMRDEYVIDPQGRHVRAKYAAKILDHGKQVTLWADGRTASRDHMRLSFQQRRHQVVGDCRHLKTDVDSYNENTNDGDPIQVIFDFTLDLEELEAAENG